MLNFAWDGHFPKKRNWVLRNYTFNSDWVLFLDADEFVADASLQSWRGLCYRPTVWVFGSTTSAGFHFTLIKTIYFYQIQLKIREKQLGVLLSL